MFGADFPPFVDRFGFDLIENFEFKNFVSEVWVSPKLGTLPLYFKKYLENIAQSLAYEYFEHSKEHSSVGLFVTAPFQQKWFLTTRNTLCGNQLRIFDKD